MNTKILIAILVVVAAMASYFAYERHQHQVEQKKVEDAFRRMKTEGKQAMPSGWGKALNDKNKK
ncbi:MAG TPA: hypothetical protein VLJ11_03095 [Bryobacteraceae bacterium]|nr:hypothetical protein [Bryobacteraceae bacterium]